MTRAFDFLISIGQVTLGLLAAILWIAVIIVIIIEIVDFLIVDPIKRSRKSEEKSSV